LCCKVAVAMLPCLKLLFPLLAVPAWSLRTQTQPPAPHEENVRRGILYFLSNVRTEYNLGKHTYLTLARDVNNGKKYGEYVAGATKKLTKEAKDKMGNCDLLNKLIEAGKSLVEKLFGVFDKPIKQLAKFGKATIAAAGAARKWVLKQIEKIIPMFLKKIIGELNMVGTIATLAGNLGNAVEAAWNIWKTRNLIDDIKQGAPSVIIEGVRNQITSHGLWSLLDTVANALTLGLNMALPGVGNIVATIKDILGYIAELFYWYKDTKKIEAIVKDAKQKYKYVKKGIKGNYAEDAHEFYKWYQGVVEDMPIISSYTLANPLIGNYHGFLSILSQTGQIVTDTQLKQNLKSLDTLKTKAREFMDKHTVRLVSKDKLVMASIDIAYGREFDEEKFDGMFRDLMRKEQWVLEWWANDADERNNFEELRSLSCYSSDEDSSDEVSKPRKATKQPKKPKKQLKSKQKTKKSEKQSKQKSKTMTPACTNRPAWVEQWWYEQAHDDHLRYNSPLKMVKRTK
jgi:hypothetical protein